MLFLVHAQDKVDMGTELLNLAEEHWSYMDAFADCLLLRGPTLSDDGNEHTGSLHVVDVSDRANAEHFAFNEPYWLAGLYHDVSIARVAVLLNGTTSIQRIPEQPCILLTGQCRPSTCDADDLEDELDPDDDDRLKFFGLLVNDDQSQTNGVVAIVQDIPAIAIQLVQPVADRLANMNVALAAQRWRLGGRSQR
jgi:uncharacterized protein YciI